MEIKKKKSKSIDMFAGKSKSSTHHNVSSSSNKIILKKNQTSPEDKK
jgi:hypothetical protein